jgi:hypothetical protein
MNLNKKHRACIWLLAVGALLSLARGAAAQAEQRASIIVAAAESGVAIDARVLGSNLPAWLNPTRLADAQFRARSAAAGLTLIRIPGGSWSNYYDWLACERGGAGIDANAECYWPWAARPSDFLDFLADSGAEAMYTVNQNGAAKEAAALVAFFNGAVDDERVIGVDVRGRDWGKVSDWARLRHDNGHPEPLAIRYWEIGNEIYGGTPDSGADCLPWGWEEVWTCDGSEYVYGIGGGAERKEGYLEFRAAMQAVDPAILVGAVGVPFQSDWSNWGNEVIAAAGDVMDFYVIHHYAYFEPPDDFAAVLARPQTDWAEIMADARAAFARHAGGRQVPIAFTEYNLFAVQEQDGNDWMSRAVNGLFMADSLGQMLQQGVSMANQWDMAHGEGGRGPGYGLMHADTYFRSPQYYVFPLWARFGARMLPVTSSLPAETMLSVYAGRVDAQTVSLLAINKTGSPIDADIRLAGVGAVVSGTAAWMQADALDATAVTFNGVADPADDLSDAPPRPLAEPGNPLAYSFAPYSVTLLRLRVAGDWPPPADARRVYLPVMAYSPWRVVTAGSPPDAAPQPGAGLPALPVVAEPDSTRSLMLAAAAAVGGALLLGGMALLWRRRNG